MELATNESAEEIRAAAYLVVALGTCYIWPAAVREKHLAMAIIKLEEIKSLERYQNTPDVVKAIDDELAILKQRVAQRRFSDSDVLVVRNEEHAVGPAVDSNNEGDLKAVS